MTEHKTLDSKLEGLIDWGWREVWDSGNKYSREIHYYKVGNTVKCNYNVCYI